MRFRLTSLAMSVAATLAASYTPDAFSRDIVGHLTKRPEIVPMEARQVTVGGDTHLLAFDRTKDRLIALTFPPSRERSFSGEGFFATGKNLIQTPKGLIFSAITPDGDCAIRRLSLDGKGEILLHEKKCMAETFSLNENFAVWVASSIHESQKIILFNSSGTEIESVAFPSIGKFLTSMVSFKKGLYGVTQKATPAGDMTIFRANSKVAIQKSIKINGAGGQLLANGEDLFLLFNLNGNPHLAAFDSDLNKRWETEVMKTIRWGTSPALLTDGNRLFFIGGNDGRLYLAVLDRFGKKLEESQDNAMRYPVPETGYSVTLKDGKLWILGAINNPLEDMKPSSAIVHFTVDVNK